MAHLCLLETIVVAFKNVHRWAAQMPGFTALFNLQIFKKFDLFKLFSEFKLAKLVSPIQF